MTLNSSQLAELITPLLGDERLDRFDSVIANRTFNVLPIVEGLYDMGNLAAIVRSADGGCRLLGRVLSVVFSFGCPPFCPAVSTSASTYALLGASEAR